MNLGMLGTVCDVPLHNGSFCVLGTGAGGGPQSVDRLVV